MVAYSAICSSVCSFARSLVRLLRSARFARALRFAHSIALLAHPLDPELMGKRFMFMN